MKKKVVPEFYIKEKPKPRAGFVPGYDEPEVELWQLWCRQAEGEDSRRATFTDLRRAGFVRRDGKEKAAGKPPRGK